MVDKKDPGKFTLRFALSDPQQRRAAQLLNEQGRQKAQFLTNAILCYVDGVSSTAEPMSKDTLEQLIRSMIDQHLHTPQDCSTQQEFSACQDDTLPVDNASLSAIIGTLQSFRK